MASLNGIGLNGYQCLVANAIEKADQLKRRIEELDFCKVLNLNTLGPSVCWWVLPRGRDAKEIFQQLKDGALSDELQTRYFDEIKRLFQKRDDALDPAQDARLSFTTSVGYCPHGISIPAWKAVFFNPKTDDEVIDRLVSSITDLV